MDYKTPQDYGAPVNGFNDDLPAILQALNSGYPVYFPWTPNGYTISQRIPLTSGTTLVFSKKRPTIRLTTPGEWCFDIAGSDITIENVRADFSHLSSGGIYLLRSDLTSMERISIKNTLSFGATTFLRDLPHSNNKIVNLHVKEASARQHRGPGVVLECSYAYQKMKGVNIDYVGSASSNFRGFDCYNNEGAFWEECDVTSGNVSLATSGNHAFHWKNCVANWVTNCMGDMVGGGGFVLDDCDHFYLTRAISSMVGTHGFSIVNSRRVSLTGCEAGGRRGMSFAPAQPGIYAANTSGLIIDDSCRTFNSTGGGVVLQNCPGAVNNALQM